MRIKGVKLGAAFDLNLYSSSELYYRQLFKFICNVTQQAFRKLTSHDTAPQFIDANREVPRLGLGRA
jgi:hypothetical protein